MGTPTELVDESGEIAWRTRRTLWGTTAWARSGTACTTLRCTSVVARPRWAVTSQPPGEAGSQRRRMRPRGSLGVSAASHVMSGGPSGRAEKSWTSVPRTPSGMGCTASPGSGRTEQLLSGRSDVGSARRPPASPERPGPRPCGHRAR
nr:hypothetical protein [Streptomyces griseolus]